MFCMGIGILICVPIFKTVTHLPPFMGILFGLGILWLVGELLHRNKEDEAQGAPDPGARPQADRHELHRLLHRHPAGGGHPGAHPHPDQSGRLAQQGRRPRRRHRHHHRHGQRHRRQRAAGGGLHGDVQPGPVPARQLSLGVHGLLRRHRRLDPHHRLGSRAWPPWGWRRSTSSGTSSGSADWP